jgi:hypothetical protein
MDTTEALRRIRRITPMMRKDVETADLSSLVMGAANNTIPKGLEGVFTPFANIFLAEQNALALKLAMDLARIFDLSKNKRFPPEKQDKASIPVLAALFSRSDVQEGLARDAGEWVSNIGGRVTAGSAPSGVFEADLKSFMEKRRSQSRKDCRKAITDFLALGQRLEVENSKEKAALARIREFRDFRLAHSLFDKEPEALPIYADLDLLLNVAKEAAKHASLAVEGLNIDFDDLSREDRGNAERYYACVLDGLKRGARALDF